MPRVAGSKKRRRGSSEAEKRLEELVFGKDILVGESEERGKKKQDTAEELSPPAVWEDEDDDLLEVNLNDTDRLKKLKTKTKSGQDVVSGSEFSSLLKERFQTRTLAWAKMRQKRSSGILQQDGSMLSYSRSAILPPGRIDIRRLVDANVDERSNKDIQSVRFHSNGSLLMAGGDDKNLRFFRIDGETNEKQLSVRFNDMSIKVAEFLNGPGGKNNGEVIVGGRRPYFYSYDTASGSLIKVPGCAHKDIKSHETLAVSPTVLSCKDTSNSHSNGYIAVAGAAGYVHLMSGKMKTWVGDVKLSSGAGVRAINFLSDHVFTASGLDAEVCMWDLRMVAANGAGGLLHKFKHDDGTCTSCLASGGVSNAQKWLAVGAESGAVSLYNNYDSDESDFLHFAKQRTVLNLTTKVTTIAFHPNGEIVAIASDRAKDQLKLVHLPSCTVFNNWPTERSPLGRVKCMDFSPGGAFLAQGDHRGRVMLYRLNHYENA